MIYMWFTAINYYKLTVEKDRHSIFTTITTIWKTGFQQFFGRHDYAHFVSNQLNCSLIAA